MVHSVIASIAPHVRVVDVTHGIAPCDVRAGGLALARAAQYLLPGRGPRGGGSRCGHRPATGGGGGRRRRLRPGRAGQRSAGPGGGARRRHQPGGGARQPRLPARRPAELGRTFDGRDVFAPAAAHLCCGVPLSALGPVINPATLTPGMLPVSHRDGDDLVAEVLWIDRFGNCQLNLDPGDLEELAPAGAPLQIAAGRRPPHRRAGRRLRRGVSGTGGPDHRFERARVAGGAETVRGRRSGPSRGS